MDEEYGNSPMQPDEPVVNEEANNVEKNQTIEPEVKLTEAFTGEASESQARSEVQQTTETQDMPEAQVIPEVQKAFETQDTGTLDNAEEKPKYTDPNEDVVPPYNGAQQQTGNQNGYSYGQYTGGQTYNQGQNHNYSQNNYQEPNSNYSQNNNQGYDNGYNPSPNYNMDDEKRVMSMGDWLLTILALMIPCAGIILYFVWAFGSGGNQNRKNFCRAQLIVMGIGSVIGIVLWGIIFATVGSSFRYYY